MRAPAPTPATHLLDVNVLLALIWPSHVLHSRAKAWSSGKRLALCPITELGFIRVSSGSLKASMADARQALSSFVATDLPEFVPADSRVLDGAAAPDSKATTDWYLANLAGAHKLKLATFDIGISHSAAERIP